MTALMRNLGGSVGISFVTTLLARQTQKHLAMLAPTPPPATRPLKPCAPALAGAWMQRGAGPCPTQSSTPARKSTAWPRSRPAC